MEGSEYDIFSRLEREMSRDLSQWRHDILSRFDVYCRIAFEAEEAKTDEPLNLIDPAVSQAIKSHLTDYLVAEWNSIDAAPKPNDFLSITGESFWHTYDSSDEGLMTYKLPKGHKIQGTLTRWDILPYIDEAGLELGAHRKLELIHKYFRPFGIHLMLDNPTITDEHGDLMSIYPERVYLPIPYERAKLELFGNP
jgi:hypothetical protein